MKTQHLTSIVRIGGGVARHLPLRVVEGRHEEQGRRARHKDQGPGEAGGLAALGVVAGRC